MPAQYCSACMSNSTQWSSGCCAAGNKGVLDKLHSVLLSPSPIAFLVTFTLYTPLVPPLSLSHTILSFCLGWLFCLLSVCFLLQLKQNRAKDFYKHCNGCMFNAVVEIHLSKTATVGTCSRLHISLLVSFEPLGFHCFPLKL